MQAVPLSDSNTVDGHAVVGGSYAAQDYGSLSSENDESYIYPKIAQTSVESISGDYREGYNDATYYTNVQNSFHPTTSITYQHFPQHAMQPFVSSSSSFTYAAGPAYYDDDPLSDSHYLEDQDSNMVYLDNSPDDMDTGSGEMFYNEDGSPGAVWMPEMNQHVWNGFDASAEHGWPSSAAATRTETLRNWTKQIQDACTQQPADETLSQQRFEWRGIIPQDPSGYRPPYSVEVGDSYYYPTHLSFDTRNTPSDFTSSESPLSPLELETCQTDVLSAVPVGSLSTAEASSSLLPEPIIHAPRPTRTIDSSFFERLAEALSH